MFQRFLGPVGVVVSVGFEARRPNHLRRFAHWPLPLLALGQVREVPGPHRFRRAHRVPSVLVFDIPSIVDTCYGRNAIPYPMPHFIATSSDVISRISVINSYPLLHHFNPTLLDVNLSGMWAADCFPCTGRTLI